MPAFTLRQLECFLAVADSGTFAAASAALHVSPTAVSAAIDDLERIIGEALTVRRRAHGVTLTTAGRNFVPRVRTLLADAAALAPGSESGVHGSISIGCYGTLAPSLLPGLIEGFEREYPAVSIEIRDGSQDELLDELESGRIDVAIMYDRDLRGPLETAHLFAMHPYVLIAADHPLAHRGTIALAELQHEPFVQFDVQPAWQNTRVVMTHAGVQPNVRYVTRNLELARSLVGRGLGYALFVHRNASNITHEGREVVTLEITPSSGQLSSVLAWNRGATSAALQAFVNWAPLHVRDAAHLRDLYPE